VCWQLLGRAWWGCSRQLPAAPPAPLRACTDTFPSQAARSGHQSVAGTYQLASMSVQPGTAHSSQRGSLIRFQLRMVGSFLYARLQGGAGARRGADEVPGDDGGVVLVRAAAGMASHCHQGSTGWHGIRRCNMKLHQWASRQSRTVAAWRLLLPLG